MCSRQRESIKTRWRKRTRSWDAPSSKKQEKGGTKETGKEEGGHPGEGDNKKIKVRVLQRKHGLKS